MNTLTLTRRPSSRDRSLVPQLENGDRLSREEFHRRYEAMPANVRAELIKGVVYMASPVRAQNHGKPHAQIMSVLGSYQISTPGLELLDNVTYIASEDYEPQPDGVLRILESLGGRSRINESDYLEGSPEFVVEIASSTASYDLHDKLELYEQKGIQEYLVWRVLDDRFDWFSLEEGKYVRLPADEQGIIESKVFPGLRLNTMAMLEDNLKQVLADLQTGMASTEYIEFAKNLGE